MSTLLLLKMRVLRDMDISSPAIRKRSRSASITLRIFCPGSGSNYVITYRCQSSRTVPTNDSRNVRHFPDLMAYPIFREMAAPPVILINW